MVILHTDEKKGHLLNLNVKNSHLVHGSLWGEIAQQRKQEFLGKCFFKFTVFEKYL